MENKARYTLVGLFLVFFTIALIAFILWQARYSYDQKKLYEYRIYSKTSIAGLKENSFVEYKGLVIGSIEKITINPKNLQEIEIVLKISEPKVIKKDSYAIIQSQGITGNKNVEIDGGSDDEVSLIPKDGTFEVIPLKASFFETLTKGAGDITQNLNSVLNNLNTLLNKKNLENISNTLHNFEQSSQTIDTTLQKFDQTLIEINKVIEKDFRDTLGSIETTANEWTNLSKELQALINEDLKSVLSKADSTLENTQGVDKVITNINLTLEKLGSTLDNFNTNGGDLLFKTRDVRYGPQENGNE